jgi:hypothetical protein
MVKRSLIGLDDTYTVTGVAKIDLASIKPGSYLGTATMPQPDGTERALEVLVFPESGRGSGEGHYPWDLRPGSMMTNATVPQIIQVDGDRRMTLEYKGGQTVVVVPSNVPIVTFEPGDRDGDDRCALDAQRNSAVGRVLDRRTHLRRQGRHRPTDVLRAIYVSAEFVPGDD